MGYLDNDGLSRVFTKLKALLNNKSDIGHTHNYAGSSSAGGSATSAVKLDSSAGSATQPVYFSSGKPVACTSYANATVGTANKLGTDTVGSTTKPIYLNAGTATASNATVGSSTKPVYMSSGTITASSDTVGGTAKPMYLSSGTMTACSSTVGSATAPVYMNAGTVTACGSSLGVSVTGSSASCTGNSATATKLATARTIGIGTGATGTATSFDGSSNITIPITSVSEAYLSWGGKNIAGNITPIGMACSTEHSANRLAFINGNALTFEYSSDGGSTWTDYGYSASVKSSFCTKEADVPIGRTSASTEYTTNSKTRVTLSAQSYVHTDPRKLLINISSSGGMSVLIEYKTGASGAAWQTFGTYSLSGWSGWNDIPLVLGTLGGGSSQTGNNWFLRLTFSMTSVNSSYPTTAQVNAIRLFGTNNWGTASSINGKGPMSATGHLYSYDIDANATFPAGVTATTFTGSLSGNATTSSSCTGNAATATKLATTRTINGTGFDGTQNITTANWGTARNIYISDSAGSNTGAAVSVNGSGNATLKLPSTIAATLSGNASTATTLATARTIQTNLGSTSSASFNGSANITPGVTGTLPVANGGTGATTLTSGAALIGNGTGAVATRSITNMTSKSYISYNTNLMTTNTLAYWNGAYSSAGASNLTYCNQGAFGTAATYAATTSVASGGTALVTSGGVYTALTNGTVSKVGTSTLGGTNKPIYLLNGVPTVCTGNAGSYTKPAYMSNGIITDCGSSLDVTSYRANSMVPITTAGTGSAYTATVSGITALTAGVSFIMVPNVVSASTAPTLNVNSLGAKTIRQRLSSNTTSTAALYSSSMLAAGKPVKMVYDGTYWIVDDMVRTDMAEAYGTLAIAHGGTGATTAADARKNLKAARVYYSTAAPSSTSGYNTNDLWICI